MEYYWKVIPRINIAFIAMGLVGFGLLSYLIKTLDHLWMGYIVSGIILLMSYKWEYTEIKK
jgi:hypothetical protein